MYKFRKKLSVLMVILVILSTNLGTELLPTCIKGIAEYYLSTSAYAASSSARTAISTGIYHSVALKNDGTVSCWGTDYRGQKLTPANVNGINNVIAVADDYDCSYAVKSDGTVWQWSYIDEQFSNSIPEKISGLEGIVDIDCGRDYTMALKSDGTVWCWGSNSDGELGNGQFIDSDSPVQVCNLTNVIAIAAGDYHAAALKSDGTVWCWGYNGWYQLGNGIENNLAVPVKVPDLSGVVSIAAGCIHTIALKNDGTVYGWGYAAPIDGGLNQYCDFPYKIDGFDGATAIAAGDFHSVVLKQDGTVWSIGDVTNFDNYGQCGTATSQMTSPVQIKGLDNINITAISANIFQNFAMKSDGSIYAWGKNDFGTLGNGTTNNTATPTLVNGLKLIVPSGAGGLSGVTLNKTSITIEVGQIEQLRADANVTWSIQSQSEGGNISLSSAGLIAALKPGTAVVRATSNIDANKHADCSVTIAQPKGVSGVSLNKYTVSLQANLSEQLIATVIPTHATNKSVIWSVTSGNDFATVDNNGLIKAISPGTAIIRATSAADNTKFAECTVIVNSIADDYGNDTTSPDILNSLTIHGAINPLGDNDYFIFAPTKSGQYTISTSKEQDDINYDTVLYLYDQNQNLIAQDDDSGESRFSTIAAELDVNKLYFIKVAMLDSSDTGRYVLGITSPYITDMSISKTFTSIKEGQKEQLSASILPGETLNKGVLWSVPTGSEYVSVKDGLVTALSPGTAVVRATSAADSTVSVDCTVEVKSLLTYYDVVGGQIIFNTSTGAITGYTGSPTVVDIPEKIQDVAVTSIGDTAFANCTSLKSVNFPDTVTSIGAGAFHGNTSLTSVIIPGSVTEIAFDAFGYCSGLTNINIPRDVSKIGDGAFGDCSSLMEINVDTDNSSFADENGVLFNKSKTSILAYPAGKSGKYVIPNGVIGIGNDAFHGCSYLTDIEIPDTVLSIGYAAFSGCDGLTSIYIPSSVTHISNYGFSGCQNLSSAYFFGDAPSLGSDAFSNVASDFKIYYLADKSGFTNNPWNNYYNTSTFTIIKNATIDKQLITYDNNDIPVLVTFNGNTLNGITNTKAGKQLVMGVDYTISDITYDQNGITTASAICTIKNSYLSILPKNAVANLTFDFNNGIDPQLSVSVPRVDECFIATAAFGSKFQPAVAMLRQFRDKCLLTNWLGCEFVKFYYKNSPPIAKFIASNDTLRGIVRGLLVPFIAIAYGILHPIQGCFGLLAVILAAVLWRRRRRKMVNV